MPKALTVIMSESTNAKTNAQIEIDGVHYIQYLIKALKCIIEKIYPSPSQILIKIYSFDAFSRKNTISQEKKCTSRIEIIMSSIHSPFLFQAERKT